MSHLRLLAGAVGGGQLESGLMKAGQLRQHLESLAAAGVLEIPKVHAIEPAAPSRPAEEPAAAVPRGLPQDGVVGKGFSPLQCLDPPAASQRGAVLTALEQAVSGCQRCAELACSRQQTVFGCGDVAARICFLGEAPGADEDASGEPFVGRAGQLLTKIIEACRLTRNDVYILNVLKCRPPGNRRPLPEEVAHCLPYVQQQLQTIAPEVICCLGATAAQALLTTTESIGKLRGRWHQYRDAAVICTYHPSYLLRNPPAKRDVWDDMKTMMRHFGVDL